MNTATYNKTQALDPAASVFVSANAGAGKTSLLTNRVLRLLLHGAPPGKILCLTFTNAAAAEMVSRVQAELGKWVMADDDKVRAALMALTGAEPDAKAIARARSLFASVLEAPEGIRIQTIHGFCQSLLRRFPLEAGVSPHFTVMDGRTEQELLQEARLRLLSHAQNGDAELQAALRQLARNRSEIGIQTLLGEIIQHKQRFRTLLATPGGLEIVIDKVWALLRVPAGATAGTLIDNYFHYDEAAIALWRGMVRILKNGDEGERKTGAIITNWFANKENRESQIADYTNVFLTQKGEQRKKLFKKSTITDQEQLDALKAEQECAWCFNDALKSLETACHSTHLLHIAEALLALYEALKRSHALMDYDDLIIASRDLLQRSGMAPWVLFKLDGGIDHILVDEAQDTSPQQWAIIDALTQEFFAGAGKSDQERSLFIVGDEKQSIYSFQGADPKALGRMQRYFSEAIHNAAKPAHRVALTHSFRSLPEILTTVDAVFSTPAAREGLMFDDTELMHIPTRLQHSGVVEVWPLISPNIEEGISSATILARTIADTIRSWLDNDTARAGEIMILVRSRTSLVDRLVRALKRRNIPVAGHDRMRLGDNLAVQDLMALGQCVLLPEDDLTLATVLKSPIFNITEEQLFLLAYHRGDKSLWECLSTSIDCAPAFALLGELRAKADFISPYELYSWLLDTNGARKRFTGRMGEETHDPIDEFLGQALLFERSHPPSLQGFLHWLAASDSEIKRDMEQAQGCVRIMTVHGAKGLQAPIVILPDTVEIPKIRDSILWHEEKELALPFWPPSADVRDTFCTGLRLQQHQAMLAEYRRLLYVALTRAQDRLYICGATAKENISEHCWYKLIENGLKPIATEFETAWGKGLRIGNPPLPLGEGRGEGDATREISFVASPSSGALRRLFPKGEGNFAFLLQPAPQEPTPSKPLSPSRATEPEPASASPLTDAALYQRGNFIHKLLQYLPNTPIESRVAAASRMAKGYKNLPEAIVESCIQEALAVMQEGQFAFLFGPESLAEVPVAGCVNIAGKTVTIAGQIDRLYIGESEVWIVDFKSNRTPPGAIPKAYIKQMQLYRALLKRIYPEKIVYCALLWTATASLSTIDDALLDEALPSSYI